MANIDEKTSASRLGSGLNLIGNGAWMTNFGNESENDFIMKSIDRNRDMNKATVTPCEAEINPNEQFARKRVVAYCRVESKGISHSSAYELQMTYYAKYIRRRPEWELVALYGDEGSTSTASGKRVGLLTMLDDARAGKFDIIVVKNLSRLSRNLMDSLAISYELKALPHPVGILFESENLFTLDKNTDSILQVLSLVAQEESHLKSGRVEHTWTKRKEFRD